MDYICRSRQAFRVRRVNRERNSKRYNATYMSNGSESRYCGTVSHDDMVATGVSELTVSSFRVIPSFSHLQYSVHVIVRRLVADDSTLTASIQNNRLDAPLEQYFKTRHVFGCNYGSAVTHSLISAPLSSSSSCCTIFEAKQIYSTRPAPGGLSARRSSRLQCRKGSKDLGVPPRRCP